MTNSYGIGEIALDYFRWHYGRGFAELMSILENFLRFLLHFFSIKLLLSTLFHPWRRMSESHDSGLQVETFLSSILVNTIMRGVGFVSRSIIILVGLLFFFFYAIAGLASIALWFLAPFVALLLITASTPLILNSLI